MPNHARPLGQHEGRRGGLMGAGALLERDSAKDRAVVLIFIAATVGLLGYAGLRGWVGGFIKVCLPSREGGGVGGLIGGVGGCRNGGMGIEQLGRGTRLCQVLRAYLRFLFVVCAARGGWMDGWGLAGGL